MAEMIPEGQGRLHYIVAAAPAMGMEHMIQQPARTRWRIITFQSMLITDVAAGNRIPYLNVVHDVNVYALWSPSQSIAASETFTFGWHGGAQPAAITGEHARVAPLAPGYLMNDESYIATLTTALDASDQWGLGLLLVEEWIEPLA